MTTSRQETTSPHSPGTPESNTRSVEALVIGGGLGGLTSAYALAMLGYSGVLLEKAPVLGGMSGSFQDELGHHFDFGLHVLDEDRNELTTRYFRRVLGQRVIRTRLHRGMLLEGSVLPYNAPVAEWPEHLRALLPDGELVDDLSERPTPDDLARVYGRRFAELIVNRGIAAYPVTQHRRNAGEDVRELLNLIYPWFFPRARTVRQSSDSGTRFHDSVRAGRDPYMLYPAEGGFATFLERVGAQLGPQFEVRTGAADLRFDVDPETRSIRSATAGGIVYRPKRVYWSAPIPLLCQLFSVQLAKLQGQTFALGNFTLTKAPVTRFEEIICADPDWPLHRISFPGRFSCQEDRLVQVEFLHVTGDRDWSAEAWRERWVQCLSRAGIISGPADVRNFHFRQMPRGYVAPPGGYGPLIELFRRELKHPASNITMPFWGVGPENINRIVPSAFSEILASVRE